MERTTQKELRRLVRTGAALLAIDALTSRHDGTHLFRPWYQ